MFLPVIGDAYYNSVSLLLPMTGADNSTTFTDYSPASKTVSRNGAIIKKTQSKWGQGSGYFDGDADYLSIATDSSLALTGDFTIETWIYLASETQDQFATILGSGQGTYINGCRYVMVGSTRIVRLGGNFGSSVDVVTAASALSASEWHHIAITRSGTSVKLFLDGVRSGADGSSDASFDFSITATYIGKNGWDGANGTFYGYLQDLRVTKGVARYSDNFIVADGPFALAATEFTIERSTVFQSSHVNIARVGL